MQRAKERESSLTDVVVDILADRYRIEVDSTGRSTDPKMDKDFLAVRLPARLDTALAVSAAKRSPKRNRQREAMVALCEHFGLDVPPPPRRGRVARAV